MLKSIRWTLQLWHAAILALALATFGTALYLNVLHEQMNRVDGELLKAAHGVIGMAPAPPRMRPGMPPDPLDRPPGPPDDPMRDDRDRPPFGEWGSQIPPDALWRSGPFYGHKESYFIVFRPDGAVIQKSTAAPDVPPVLGRAAPPPGPLDPPFQPDSPQFRQRGSLREVIIGGPQPGIHLLVGRSLEPEFASLAQLRWTLLGSGLVILAIGLCGGRFLAARIIRPIRTITQTARTISGSDLSGRISVAETQSELGALAQTLNDTFARLETAFQRQVRFTADASHELRTPLSVVHSHAELALSRDRSPAEYKLALEACLRGAQRMKTLVESLLVLARADAGKLQLQPDSFDLQHAVQECLAMVTPQAQAHGITIETHLEPTPIQADHTRILQVITNLLANAIQYNRPDGKIVVSLMSDNTHATLTIADTGIGIPPEEQAHIFERFFRVDKARSRDAGGNGLGLAICKGIVDAHGGSITFTSRPNDGTTFTVTLPHAAA